MIAKYYGRTISLQKLRAISDTTREGSTLKNTLLLNLLKNRLSKQTF
jgi:ABC-type bacteriocin/lantibiotic exporter with double-glycine peptidase domain